MLQLQKEPLPACLPGRRANAEGDSAPSVFWAFGRFSAIQFSPFDLRVYLRIIAICLAWKLLSTDYKALAELIHGVDLAPHAARWESRLVHAYQGWLLNTPSKIVTVQVLGSGLLLLSAFTLRRALLLLALAPVLLVELCAFQYRSYLWAVEPILAALIIYAFWPRPWREVLTGGREVTKDATYLGASIVLYFSWAYFFCGLSKVLYDPYWFQHVHIEHWYVSRSISKGPLPEWIDPIAYQLHLFFSAYPSLAAVSALGVQLIELGWGLSLISSLARRTLPLFMFLSHVMMFLCSGFLFLNFAIAAFAITIPWRRLGWPTGHGKPADEPFPAKPWKFARPVAAACLIIVSGFAILPAWRDADYYPFLNFNRFAWSMSPSMGPCSVYSLGFIDMQSGSVAPIPPNHSGFLDYKQVLATNPLDDYVNSLDPGAKKQTVARVEQYVRALRPHESNRFILGPLSFPSHVLQSSTPIPRHVLAGELRILRIDYNFQKHGLMRTITDLGPVPRLEN